MRSLKKKKTNRHTVGFLSTICRYVVASREPSLRILLIADPISHLFFFNFFPLYLHSYSLIPSRWWDDLNLCLIRDGLGRERWELEDLHDLLNEWTWDQPSILLLSASIYRLPFINSHCFKQCVLDLDLFLFIQPWTHLTSYNYQVKSFLNSSGMYQSFLYTFLLGFRLKLW